MLLLLVHFEREKMKLEVYWVDSEAKDIWPKVPSCIQMFEILGEFPMGATSTLFASFEAGLIVGAGFRRDGRYCPLDGFEYNPEG